MPLIVKQHTYIDDDPIIYSDLNANWDTLYNLVNGNLDNSNIASGAAIDPLKISGGAVTLATTQTIAGQKTLIKPILNAVQNVTQETFAGNILLDMSQSNVHVIPLEGNAVLSIDNITLGQYFSVELIQDSSGNKTVTWFPNISWVASNAPTLTTTPNKKDTFVFRCTAGGSSPTFNGYVVGLNIG